MKTQELLYEGKAKKIFKTDNPEILLMEYKDSLTAFNALKKGEFAGKGALNCKISTLIFKLLSQHNIKHHWIETRADKFMVVHRTRIIPEFCGRFACKKTRNHRRHGAETAYR